MLDLFTKSAGEVLDRWFESAPIKAAFGFDAVVGNYASPYTPGSAYVLLHHVFGEVNGQRGQWGHARGGMGAITQAMAAECAARGVALRTGAAVARVVVDGGKAVGVELADGEIVRARRVVANVNPKLLFQHLVAPEHLPADFLARIAGYRCGSGTFRMNVALSELPDFTALPGTERASAPRQRDRHRAVARLHGARLFRREDRRLVEGADRRDAAALGRRRQPRAAPGMHVASLFCQHVHPELAQVRPGRTWDDARDEVADLMIDTVNRVAPNFKASVLGRRALTPLDLEREFGLIGGDIFHGALALDQLFSARPVLGHGNYRSPRARPLHVRRRNASGRRRHGRARSQCRARNPEGRAAAAV